MIRGRKKGGIKVNELTDREDIVNKIINQINSLNKKVKKFENNGIKDLSNYINKVFTDDMIQYNSNGSISKSKLFYASKNNVWLKKTLTSLIKTNNHETLGTLNKYKKELKAQDKKILDFAERYFRDMGYNEIEIAKLTSDKGFLSLIYDSFNEGLKGYTSGTVIEKIALDYGDKLGLDSNRIEKILSNIEYARNTKIRNDEESKEYEELLARKRAKQRQQRRNNKMR